MSAKRVATSNLTHENWDQEDPSDQEEMGTYKMASKDVLEKRVFKTAKRRMRTATGDEPKKASVFSGFGGFNKTQPSSFDFLSNLTNGNKTTNGTAGSNEEIKTNLFSNGGTEKPSTLFSIPSTSTNTKITFGTPNDSQKLSFGTSNDATKVSFGTSNDDLKVSFGTTNDASKASLFGSPTDSGKISFGIPKDSPKMSFGAPNDAAKKFFGKPNDSAKTSHGNSDDAVKMSFGTSNDTAKVTFQVPKVPPKISFGVPTTSKESGRSASLFMASKPDLTASPSKSAESEQRQATFTFKPSPNKAATVPSSSSLFSVSAASSKTEISLTSGSSASNLLPSTSNSYATCNTAITKSSETQNDTVKDKKIVYYTKLKGLNESVSKWIQKHVEMTPLCILTPIFNDYLKYLKELQDDYKGNDDNKHEEENSKTDKDTSIFSTKTAEKSTPSIFGTANPDGNKTASPFDTKASEKPSTSIFGSCTPSKPITPLQASSTPKPGAKDAKPSFSFGINPSVPKSDTDHAPASSVTATSSPSTGGFSFGIKTTPAPTTSSSLFTLPTTGTSPPSAPFSFGLSAQKFNFSPNTKKTETEESKNDDEEEDQPPKVEFTPIVEENSVYDKKCKVFVKKDGKFADIGVGTLYIKTIENSTKHQLLVRANTNLGTILVNLVLAAAIPVQRMGKNNVMMICIPTPDSKPPPTSILLRVKTGEEADELLETLNKYKV